MISSTRRENYKAILGCTDEQIDALVQIVVNANANGINIDLNRFVLLVSRGISMSEFGYSTKDPIGILDQKSLSFI